MHRKFTLWSLILVGICSFIFGVIWLTGMQSTNYLPAVEKNVNFLPSFAPIIKKASNSVVNISTIRVVKPGPVFKYFFGPFGEEDPFREFFEKFFGEIPEPEFKQRSLGSGFILDKEGYILTNNHVVEKAREISVRLLNKKEYRAEIVGRDPKTDIALLKIHAKGLQPLPLGDSDELQVGDWVIAIGNPFGLGHTVTVGIISAKERVIGAGPYDNFLQTDAAINPGNSGGPLLNLKGEVIGINTAIVAQAQGIGFAIPINMAKNVVTQLKRHHHVIRGWLGVMIQQVTPQIAQALGLKTPEGALVGDVTPGGPADKAGIKRGDVIIEYDGHPIKEMNELPRLVAMTPVGKKVKVKVWRNGKIKTFEVKIGELKEETIARRPQVTHYLGMKVRKTEQGVMIIQIRRGSAAAEAGLRRGDIILEINRRPIRSEKDYYDVIRRTKPGSILLFLIKRENMTIFIPMRMPK